MCKIIFLVLSQPQKYPPHSDQIQRKAVSPHTAAQLFAVCAIHKNKHLISHQNCYKSIS